MSEHKGLTVYFFRTPGRQDCTKGGVSSRRAMGTVTGILEPDPDSSDRWGIRLRRLDRTARVFAPTDDRPAVWLYARDIGGERVWCVIPAMTGDPDPTPDQLRMHSTLFAMGGNYASTSDSRLSQNMGEGAFYGALAVHDRCESGRPF